MHQRPSSRLPTWTGEQSRWVCMHSMPGGMALTAVIG